MKAYTQVIPGKAYTVDYGYTPPFNSEVTSNSSVITLSAPGANKGNFVDPTAWNYVFNQTYVPHGIVEHYDGTVLRSRKSGILDYSGIPLPTWDNRNTVYNLALGRLNDQLRGDLDLSIALGESGTTARMLKNTAKLLRFARGKMPPGGFGSTRDIANGYLQWKYGWKPLMNDVFSAANESINQTVNYARKVKARAAMPIEFGGRVTYTSVGSVYGGVPFSRESLSKCYQACEIGVSLEVPQTVHNVARWTSMNPVSIAWELIPYSFVVDWFVDIGSYLRNMETGFLYNSIFKVGYKSELFRYHFMDNCPKHKVTDPGWGTMDQCKDVYASFRHVEFNRQILTSYPLPYRPTVKVDLGSSQLLSAAALLRQLLPGKRRGSSGNVA